MGRGSIPVLNEPALWKHERGFSQLKVYVLWVMRLVTRRVVGA
jgi:hypothetical protein